MRPGIVHRLDKDTSGVMLAAKASAHTKLTEMFAAHDLERCYRAVLGMPGDNDGRIEAPLGCPQRDRKKQAVAAKAASPPPTGDASPSSFASLVECRLETGRTDQGPYGASRAWGCRRLGLWQAACSGQMPTRRATALPGWRFPRQALMPPASALRIR